MRKTCPRRRSPAFALLLPVFLLVACLSGVALADLPFAATCKYKVASQVTLYTESKGGGDEVIMAGEGGEGAAGSGYAGLTPFMTLPAGTYIRYLDGDSVTAAHSELAHVIASLDNTAAGITYGYVQKSAIVSAVVRYTLSDGTEVTIPEYLLRDRKALDTYLTQEYGETSILWTEALAEAAERLGTTTGTKYTDEAGEEHDAVILTLGLGRSLVSLDDAEEDLWVPTCALSWDAETEPGKTLALINAKKQGYASLRGKASSKGTTLMKCDTNKVVRVIKPGKKYTLIDCDGLRGYVATGTLTFVDNEPKVWVRGLVSFRGKTSGSKNKVHVRSSGSNKGRVIGDEYPVGTEITVFAQEDGWCEVDIDGYHCYIKDEYVTLSEPFPTPTPTPMPTPAPTPTPSKKKKGK